MIASIAATCTDGTKLPAVATPRLKAGYITAYGTAVDITADTQAPPLSDDLNNGEDGEGDSDVAVELYGLNLSIPSAGFRLIWAQ